MGLKREEVAIHCLLYGKYHHLHERLLKSLHQHAQGCPVRIWCNQVCPDTVARLIELRHKSSNNWTIQLSDINVPKYHVMRQMFQAFKTEEADRNPALWALWFDDDSWIHMPDWWSYMSRYIDARPHVTYIGKSYYVHHLPGQDKFFEQAPWFKNVPWEQCPTKNPTIKKPGITFAQGGYWWLKTDWIRVLDWPDPRLSHNGGDTLLGEALRQQGVTITNCCYGVNTNDAPRRGLNEVPAGCVNPNERR